MKWTSFLSQRGQHIHEKRKASLSTLSPKHTSSSLPVTSHLHKPLPFAYKFKFYLLQPELKTLLYTPVQLSNFLSPPILTICSNHLACCISCSPKTPSSHLVLRLPPTSLFLCLVAFIEGWSLQDPTRGQVSVLPATWTCHLNGGRGESLQGQGPAHFQSPTSPSAQRPSCSLTLFPLTVKHVLCEMSLQPHPMYHSLYSWALQ